MASPTLIQRTGKAAFWNTVLIPAQALIGLTFTVVVARRFGLDAGVYVTAMSVAATVVVFTSVGIPTSLTKFLPEIEATAGSPAVVVFLRRAALIRLLLIGVVLIPLNLFAQPLSEALDMGAEGVLLLQLASVLIVARAVIELAARTLTAFFCQLQSNSLQLLQGILDIGLAGAAVVGGYQIAGVFGMVVASGVVTAFASIAVVRRMLGSLETGAHGGAFAPADPEATRAAVDAERSRFTGFTMFTFLFELSIYFSGKDFANPALAIVLGREDVAIFAYGYTLAFMSVGLMVASFRGVYRPMFAHLRARNDPHQLQKAFAGVSKAQLVILVPAGVGLFVMSADYIPLLFGAEFTPAVPVARTFVTLLYTQAAFNLGMIWLSIDERYRAVLWTQAILVIVAPFFLIMVGSAGLVAAAILFGGARLVVSVTGYLICRRDYGFRFPWLFAARVGVVAAIMATVLVVLRRFLEPSLLEASALTALGAVIYLVGLRLARVLGPEEIELLERSDVPGKRLALAWLAPNASKP